MVDQLALGFSTGISTGIYCLGACLPIFIPLLLTDKKKLKSSFRIVLEFSLGRLLGYLIFGAFLGFLGQVIRYQLIHRLAGLATGLTGLLLIIYSFSLLKWKSKSCQNPFKRIKIPLCLGFLTGVNVCPPFLVSLTYVFGLKDVLKSLLYFLSFFFGTSLYIVPAAFLGWFSEDNLIQKIAKISGVIVGIFFVFKGVILAADG